MKIKVDSLDDLWVMYNIISRNDTVYGKTWRRIKQSEEAARADKGERVPVYLGIRVEDVSFHGFSDRLRIKGKIVDGPEDLVSIGSFHTLNVDADYQLEIFKEKWSKLDLKRINEAIRSTSSPTVILCAVDSDEATIALMGGYQTKIYARVTESIPGKRLSDKDNFNAYQRFYSSILNSIDSLLFSYKIDYLVIAGPGFVKDNLYNYIINRKPELKGKIIVDTVSGGDVSSINEIIRRGAASTMISKIKVIEQSKLIEEVLKRLAKSSGDVAYGFEDVKDAVLKGAVGALIITDEMLREGDVIPREEIYKLLELVENTGGDISILSVANPPGEQLKGLGGVAALLRFPLFKDSKT